MQKSKTTMSGIGATALLIAVLAGGALKLDKISKAYNPTAGSAPAQSSDALQIGIDLGRGKPSNPGCCIPSNATCVSNLNPRSCAQVKGYSVLNCDDCVRRYISSDEISPITETETSAD